MESFLDVHKKSCLLGGDDGWRIIDLECQINEYFTIEWRQELRAFYSIDQEAIAIAIFLVILKAKNECAFK